MILFKKNTIAGITVCLLVGTLSYLLIDPITKNLFNLPEKTISPITLAILIGLLLRHFFRPLVLFEDGYQFCIKNILKLGIMLLGIKLSIFQVFNVSMISIIVVLPCIIFTLLLVLKLSRHIKISKRLSMLIAVGTSICGASAIAATAPAINAKKEEMSYAISNIAFFGLFSMIIYPYLANFLFSKNTIGVGLFLGSAIHDTSQVTGAAIIYDQIFGSTDVLKIATVTKLLRNTAMIIVIPLISIKFNTISKKSVSFKNSIKFFPIFILGFILFSTFRSIGDYFLTDSNLSFVILNENNWTTIISIIDFFSKLLLTISMAGVGLSTNLHLLKNMGLKIFYFGFFISCIVGLVSIVLIKFFIIK